MDGRLLKAEIILFFITKTVRSRTLYCSAAHRCCLLRFDGFGVVGMCG